jgi:hypothetical protein
MQRDMNVILAPADAVANSIAQAQAPGGAGNLNLNGAAMTAGVVAMDIPRRIGISSTGDETGRKFTVIGIGRNGQSQTEVVKGPGANLTVNTLKDYASGALVIAIDGASAGNITVGTSQMVSTQWFPIDKYDTWGVGFDVDLVGIAATYSVETTVGNPNPPGNVNPQTDIYLPPRGLPGYTNSNNSDGGAVLVPCTAIRLTLTQFATGIQANFRLVPASVGDA